MPIAYVYLDGEKISRAEYCRRLGYSYSTIQGLMRRHKVSFEEAVEEFQKPKNKRKWAKRVSKDRRLYHIWHQMMDRCYNPKNKSYHLYGGRKPKPIQVCDRWHNYFNFEDDLFDNYIYHCKEYGIKETTIDRFPNKLGNYEPSNIRWATRKEQNNNLTSNIVLIDDLTVKQFSEEYDLNYSSTLGRYHAGWTIDEILNPSLKIADSHKIFAPTGENLDELAERLGVCVSTLKSRYNKGWDWDDIINTPVLGKILTPTGETLHELSERINISYNALKARYEDGWDWDDIINTPLGGNVIHAPTGETISEVAKKLHMSYSTIRQRLKQGWTWDMIFSTPSHIISPTGESVPQLAERLKVHPATIYRKLRKGYSWEEIEENTCSREYITTPTGESISEMSKRLHISESVIYKRIRQGWEWKEIENTPVCHNTVKVSTELSTNNPIISPTGETLTELSERLNIPYETLYARYHRGWDWERLMNTPNDKTRFAPTGETIDELSKRLNISKDTIECRLKRGWTWEEILTIPLGGRRKKHKD